MMVKDSPNQAPLDGLLKAALACQLSALPVIGPTFEAIPACMPNDPTPPYTGFLGNLGKSIKRLVKPAIGSMLRKSRNYYCAAVMDELTRFQASQSLAIEGIHAQLVRQNEDLHSLHGELELAHRRRHVDCGGDLLLIQSEVGAIFFSRKDTTGLAKLLTTGELGRGRRLLLEKILLPGDTYLDVGAHPSYYTLAAARALRKRGNIWAIQPYEPDAKLLRSTLNLHDLGDWVRLFPFAPGHQLDKSSLHLAEDPTQLAMVNHPSVLSTVSVEIKPLDTLCQESQYPDVSSDTVIRLGYPHSQIEILKGANQWAKGETAWLVEFDGKSLVEGGTTPAKWRSAFEDQGLIMRVVDPHTGQLKHWLQERLCAEKKATVLFARPLSSIWQKAGAL